MDEFNDQQKKGMILSQFTRNCKDFLKDYLQAVAQDYPLDYKAMLKKDNLYGELVDCLARMVDFNWQKILVHRDIKDIYEIPVHKTEEKLELKVRMSIKELTGKLKKIYFQSGESGLKIKDLLVKLDRENLATFFALFLNIIAREKAPVTETELVGIYTSGVFLAHLVNLVFGFNKRVWLFKVYPHALTHPVHRDERGTMYNLSVFDESVKTLFSLSVYENYLLRNTHTLRHNINVFSLFNFQDYSRVNLRSTPTIRSLIKCKTVGGERNLFLSPSPLDDSTLSLDLYDRQTLKHILTDFIKDQNRFNIYSLLTNSRLVFSVAHHIAKQIKTKMTQAGKKKVCIFSYSVDGEILLLPVVFFLKMDSYQVIYPENQASGIIKDDIFLAGIDLSLDSGFTRQYSLEKLQEHYGLKEPDKEFFIYKREDGIWNVMN